MPEQIRVRRGDLAILEIKSSYTAQEAGQRPRAEAAAQYRVAVVTSVTRDGHAKAVREDAYGPGAGMPTPPARFTGFQRLWIVPSDQIDVDAAQEAAREHRWPSGHTGMPFDSLDDVRGALRPHLTARPST